MKVVKWIAILILMATALFVGVGLLLPAELHVERSVAIDAPAGRIHVLVGELRNWPEWTPWQESDPTIRITYGETTSGVGAHQSWTGDSGNGELTVVESDPSRGVRYEMNLDGNFPATGGLSYRQAGEGTEVVWVMDAELRGVLSRYLGLMLPGLIEAEFDKGLAKLKTRAEAMPPIPEPGAAPAGDLDGSGSRS